MMHSIMMIPTKKFGCFFNPFPLFHIFQLMKITFRKTTEAGGDTLPTGTRFRNQDHVLCLSLRLYNKIFPLASPEVNSDIVDKVLTISTDSCSAQFLFYFNVALTMCNVNVSLIKM